MHRLSHFAALSLLAVNGAAAGPFTIGLDAVHGFDAQDQVATGSPYAELRATITAAGGTIVPLYAFTAANLAGLDAVFLVHPYDQNSASFSVGEIADLQAFVAAGGGMVACGNSGSGSSGQTATINALLAPYGVSFDANGSDAGGHTINAVDPHPVTDCVTFFGIDFQQILSIGPPALDLTPGGGSDDALAVADVAGPCGHLVFISDTTMFYGPGLGSDRPLAFGDNRKLIENAVLWAACQPVIGCNPLDVVFSSIEARVLPEGVEIAWRTESESHTLGFVIEAAPAPAGPFAVVGDSVAARGAGSDYGVLVASPPAPWYRVVEYTDSGDRGTLSPVLSPEDGLSRSGRKRSEPNSARRQP